MTILRFHPFEFDPAAGLVYRGDEETLLPPKAAHVLQLLLENAGQLVSKDELFETIWAGAHVTESSLTDAVSLLRQVLGDDARNPTYIQTIPRRGYRFIGDVDEPFATGFAEDESAEIGGIGARLLTGRGAALGTAAALVILVTINAGGLRDRLLPRSVVGVPDPASVRVLAVMPPAFSGDPEQRYVANGMNDALNVELGRISSLRMKSPNSAAQFASRPLAEIGANLGVDGVVETSVIVDDERVMITASLSHATLETQMWSESYSTGRSDLLSFVRSIARDIASEIEIELTAEEQQRLAAAPRRDPRAEDAYFRGRMFCNNALEDANDFPQAIAYFTEATEIQPAFAEAWSSLAACYTLRELSETTSRFTGGSLNGDELARAREAADIAISLDDTLPEAHAALGFAKFFADWDFVSPQADFERSIALNGSLSETRLYYATYLVLSGRPEEAIAENQEAIDLDPGTATVSNQLSWVYTMGRRFDDGIAHTTRLLNRNPDDMDARRHLAVLYAFTESYPEAVRLCDEERWSDCAWIYAVAGEQNKAREMLPALGNPVATAVVYGALGEPDRALESLDDAFRGRDPWFVAIEANPQMEDLRADPGFQLRVSGPRRTDQDEPIKGAMRWAFPRASLHGAVTDPDGAPLLDVTVTVRHEEIEAMGGIETRTAFTAAAGAYDINGLRPGTHTITFVLEGFSTVEHHLELRDGQSESLDVQMVRSRLATRAIRLGRRVDRGAEDFNISGNWPTRNLFLPANDKRDPAAMTGSPFFMWLSPSSGG